MTPLPHLHLRALSEERASALLVRAVDADPTYDAVGGTLEPGAALDLHERCGLGDGVDTFDRAVDFVRRFGPQRSIGAVWPGDAEVRLGGTALVAPRIGPVTLTALVRIVAVVAEPDRWGYAYGTLPGHPECGEEAFVVERAADGEVLMRVAARSHPAVPGGRWLVPLAVPVQRHYVRRYLAATAEVVR